MRVYKIELDPGGLREFRAVANKVRSRKDRDFLLALAHRAENPECGKRCHIGGGVFDTCGQPKGHSGECGV